MLNIFQYKNGLRIVPSSTSSIDRLGEIEVSASIQKMLFHNGTDGSPFVTESHSASLINKTIDADLNFLSNIDNNEIKALAGIDASKIANGSVSSIEFQYLDGVTSNIQTQIDAAVSSGANKTLSNLTSPTSINQDLLPLNTGGQALGSSSQSFGALHILGNMNMYGNHQLIIYDADNSNKISIQSPAIVASDYTLTLPPDDGTSGQFLQTDGSGILTWATGSGGGITTIGTIDSQSKSANGLVISGSSLVAQTADASFPGLVSITTQTFNGLKTFQGSGIKLSAINDNAAGLSISTSNNQDLTLQTLATGNLLLNASRGVAINEQSSSPSQPPSGFSSLYFKTDHFLYSKDSSGVERNIGSQFDALTGTQIATPSNPAAGKDKLYFKTDDNLYMLDSSGNERLVGPGMVGSDWNNTLSWTLGPGFGSPTNVSIYTRRVGDSMEVIGTFKAGTIAGTSAYIQLPGGFLIDTAKLPSTSLVTEVGMWHRVVTGSSTNINTDNSSQDPVVYDGSTNNQLFFPINTAANAYIKTNGNNIFATNDTMSFKFTIPISGWSANNGPGRSGFQFYASSQVTTSSSSITSTSFVTFSNSPALTFTPTVTGTYKVYSSLPIQSPNGTSLGGYRIFNTTGSGTLLEESQGIFGSFAGIGSVPVQNVYTLTAGTMYIFDIQGKDAGAQGIMNRGDLSPFYVFAELCG